MNAKQELTDRERILMFLVDQLRSTAILRPRIIVSYQRPLDDDAGYVHFAKYRKPQKGDLVIGDTGGVGKWKIGWYVEPRGDGFGGAVIRSIGDGQLCNYGNESFTPIIGMPSDYLLEGDQREFHAKLMCAFRKGDEYMYRYGGLSFDGNVATVTVREVFGGMISGGSVPFDVSMPWNKRTSVKAILQALRDGGYGTREFEKAQLSKASA